MLLIYHISTEYVKSNCIAGITEDKNLKNTDM